MEKASWIERRLVGLVRWLVGRFVRRLVGLAWLVGRLVRWKLFKRLPRFERRLARFLGWIVGIPRLERWLTWIERRQLFA